MLCKVCNQNEITEAARKDRRATCNPCKRKRQLEDGSDFNGRQRRHYRNKREQVFDHYGRACAYCGSVDDIQIDHMDGDGKQCRTQERKAGGFYYWLAANNFPPNFQTLCKRCNLAKSNISDAEFREWIIAMAARFTQE